MASAEARNLEAISRAIDQHNVNCPFPAAEVRMNPFELERLGWERIRGLPLVPDPELGTGRFRIVCSRDPEGEGMEEVEAIGRVVSGRSTAKGAIWQLTAIDVASSYAWAELVICKERTPGRPSAKQTSKFARRLAAALRDAGWRLERLLSDNGNEFKGDFAKTVCWLQARHTRIHAGRPQTNGNVEALHKTILEECWRAAFARYFSRVSPACNVSSTPTCASTTSIASTTAGGLPARSPRTSSTVPARWRSDEPPGVSAHLGVRAG